MDFYNAYEREKQSQGDGFGKSRLYIRVRDRIHLSLSSVEKSSSELQINKSAMKAYDDSIRYVLAKGITFDLLVLLYDVNTSGFFAFRAAQEEDLKMPVKEFVSKLKRPNIEIRAIGMQNSSKDYGTGLANVIEAAYTLCKPYARLVEVDLFGTDQRNIAIDTKLGMTFDLLLFDRFYKPGELANTLSAEAFKAQIGVGSIFSTAKQKK